MAMIYRERSLLEFQKAFATEEACAQHLKEVRWPDGFVCPRCGHGEAWFIRTRKILDCKACRAQTSLTAGTIFHKTRTPLLKWYWIIYHMALKKVGVSVSEMQRALEIKDYKTAWLMAHKIRKAMADRDARYQLAGLVEMDESFFGPPGEKRGRGSERKITVLCAGSLYRDQKGRERPGFAICGWWKMRLLHPLRVFWKGSAVGQEHLKEGRCWRQSGPTDGDPMGGLRKIRV